MIIWKGLGILAFIIPFTLGLLLQLIFGDSSIFSGSGYAIGGILVWILGRKLNTNNERIITDPKTGQQTLAKFEHSMFWIKMELWAPIFLILGISIAMSDMTNDKSTAMLFPILGLMLLSISLYSIYNNRKNLKHAISSNLKPKSNITNPMIAKSKKKKSKIDSFTTNDKPKLNLNSRNNLTEKEKEKKQFFDELRSNKNQITTSITTTDHSKYMPRNNNSDNA